MKPFRAEARSRVRSGLCAALLAGLFATGLGPASGVGPAAAESSDADCDQCRGFPALCRDIVTCVKSCGVPKAQAKSCLDLKYIDAARYTEATGQRPPTEQDKLCQSACRTFPPLCKQITACIQRCGTPKVQARNCYDNKHIDAATYTEATGEPAPPRK